MENILVGYQIEGKMCWRKFQFPNKHRILNTVFERYVYDLYDDYRIREEIEVLVIENATFYHDMKLYCPSSTKVILKNCTFLGRYVQFFGGDISLLFPRFLDYSFSEQIGGESMENFVVMLDKIGTLYGELAIGALAKNISIKVDGMAALDNYSLCLEGDNIEIDGMRNLKEAKIVSKNLTLKYSDLDFVSYSRKDKIEVENLLLGASELSKEVMEKIHCKKMEILICDEIDEEDNLEVEFKKRKRVRDK